MDDRQITPRRALPPVPPAARASATATLPPPDQTTWFDPLDPLNDSAVHPAGLLGPLDDGTAAGAARDLIRESGRQPVLDAALLEALDTAARAAAARRAVTLDLPDGTTPATPPVVVAPATDAAPAVAVPAVPTTRVVAPLPQPDETAVDVAAEFARHDDLVDTGQHGAVEDSGWVYDSAAHPAVLPADTALTDLPLDDDEYEYDEPGPLTHRTVVARSSRRRWIPAGVGAGVLAIVGAVLLTSGFGADGAATGTDEAARTGQSSTAPASTTPAPSMPAMATLDLSGTGTSSGSGGSARPSSSSADGGVAAATQQPQVAAAPSAAGTQVATGGTQSDTAGSGSGSGTAGAGGSSSGTVTSTSPSTTTPENTTPATASSDPGTDTSTTTP